jgi:hypothetical protein
MIIGIAARQIPPVVKRIAEAGAVALVAALAGWVVEDVKAAVKKKDAEKAKREAAAGMTFPIVFPPPPAPTIEEIREAVGSPLPNPYETLTITIPAGNVWDGNYPPEVGASFRSLDGRIWRYTGGEVPPPSLRGFLFEVCPPNAAGWTLVSGTITAPDTRTDTPEGTDG